MAACVECADGFIEVWVDFSDPRRPCPRVAPRRVPCPFCHKL